MPNKHKNPMLGWRPPAEHSARVREEAKRRGVDLKVVLDEMLADWIARLDAAHQPDPG